jgi:hypothetical protein
MGFVLSYVWNSTYNEPDFDLNISHCKKYLLNFTVAVGVVNVLMKVIYRPMKCVYIYIHTHTHKILIKAAITIRQLW